MKKNMKYLYWCLLILCGGFAVLEYLDGSRVYATMWLAALAVIVLIWSIFFQNKDKLKKDDTLESILEPQTRQDMLHAKKLDLHPEGIHLRKGESVRWYDAARQDYYDGKKGKMYLSTQRIFFYADKDKFSFSHPVNTTVLKETKNGVELNINGSKMKFVTASTPELLEQWNLLQQEQNLED